MEYTIEKYCYNYVNEKYEYKYITENYEYKYTIVSDSLEAPWILYGGFWSDEGLWIDTESWED